MNVKKYIIGSIAVFVFIFLAEFVFHGMIMQPNYSNHMDILRPQEDADANMSYMATGFLVLAFGFCYIFIQGYKGTGVGEGIRFGLYTTLTFTLSTKLINHTVFPWPADWIGTTTLGEGVIFMAAGALIAMLYKE